MNFGKGNVLAEFNFKETFLSPKDLELHVSRRIRVFLFVSAWFSVVWFICGASVESIRFIYGSVLVIFQLWWTFIIVWVCFWGYQGMKKCAAVFQEARDNLTSGHTFNVGGYVVPDLIHWVIVPNYKEHVDVVRGTLRALSLQSIGAQRICIILACEAAEIGASEKLLPLASEFPGFCKIVINTHVLRPGEAAGKSANVSCAFRSLCAAVHEATRDDRLLAVASELALDFTNWKECPDARSKNTSVYNSVLDLGIVTVVDADSILHPFHLYEIEKSYHFDHHADHDRCIWQAPICNMLNMYDVPAVSRLASITVSVHELASLMHPTEQKLPFSTYSLTTKLALDMGGWASDVLAEDWHCFSRAFFAKRGLCKVVPLHFPVLCYSVEEETYLKSIHARFVQACRHAWGVIEVSSAFAFWRDLPWYNRPAWYSFVAVLWKMFKLHFITIFQTPMVIGTTIFNWNLAKEGYSITEPRNLDPLWWIFSFTTLLMTVLPVVTIFTTILAIKYETLLSQQRSDMRSELTMPASSLSSRFLLALEFLFVMPATSLLFGFIPALIAHSCMLFRKHYTYVVASKPSTLKKK
jgi:hypothetical protein